MAPQPKPEDLFYEIGFTHDDILAGALIRSLQLSTEHLRMMGELAKKYGPLSLAAKSGHVVKKMVEVYFVNSFVDDEAFAKRYGNKYQLVNLYNETAFELSNKFGIPLPPAIGKITRAELPEHLGISMQFPSYTEQ